MARPSTRIEILNPNEHHTHIRVSIDYDEGGVSYYDGHQRKRGLHAYVTPIGTKKYSDGMATETSILGQGRKVCLLEMTRRNTKKHIELAKDVLRQLNDRTGPVWFCVVTVAAEYGLVLPGPAVSEADHVAQAVVADLPQDADAVPVPL